MECWIPPGLYRVPAYCRCTLQDGSSLESACSFWSAFVRKVRKLPFSGSSGQMLNRRVLATSLGPHIHGSSVLSFFDQTHWCSPSCVAFSISQWSSTSHSRIARTPGKLCRAFNAHVLLHAFHPPPRLGTSQIQMLWWNSIYSQEALILSEITSHLDHAYYSNAAWRCVNTSVPKNWSHHFSLLEFLKLCCSNPYHPVLPFNPLR